MFAQYLLSGATQEVRTRQETFYRTMLLVLHQIVSLNSHAEHGVIFNALGILACYTWSLHVQEQNLAQAVPENMTASPHTRNIQQLTEKLNQHVKLVYLMTILYAYN